MWPSPALTSPVLPSPSQPPVADEDPHSHTRAYARNSPARTYCSDGSDSPSRHASDAGSDKAADLKARNLAQPMPEGEGALERQRSEPSASCMAATDPDAHLRRPTNHAFARIPRKGRGTVRVGLSYQMGHHLSLTSLRVQSSRSLSAWGWCCTSSFSATSSILCARASCVAQGWVKEG